MIKSAASAASLGFAGERQDDGPACGRRGTGRSAANPREAALAADLITASLIRLRVVPGQDSGLRASSKRRDQQVQLHMCVVFAIVGFATS